MYYEDDEGKLIGVLNDYDLSSLANALGPQGNERTGTVPFMALDLLTERGQRGQVEHLYRHDLESFVWVLPWVVLRYRDGKLLTSDRPLDEWATKDALTVREKKTAFLKDFATLVKPSDVDLHIWNLMISCLFVLYEQEDRLVKIRGKQVMSKIAGKSKESDEEQPELADDVLLREFTTTEAWVQLSKLIE